MEMEVQIRFWSEMEQDKYKVHLIGSWKKISIQIKYGSIIFKKLVHFTFLYWPDKSEAYTLKTNFFDILFIDLIVSH